MYLSLKWLAARRKRTRTDRKRIGERSGVANPKVMLRKWAPLAGSALSREVGKADGAQAYTKLRRANANERQSARSHVPRIKLDRRPRTRLARRGSVGCAVKAAVWDDGKIAVRYDGVPVTAGPTGHGRVTRNSRVRVT